MKEKERKRERKYEMEWIMENTLHLLYIIVACNDKFYLMKIIIITKRADIKFRQTDVC